MALTVRPLAYALNWITVSSSWIARIAYQPHGNGGNLFVETKGPHGAKQYMYASVPRFIWQAFQQSTSKGTYWNATIRKRYAESRIA